MSVLFELMRRIWNLNMGKLTKSYSVRLGEFMALAKLWVYYRHYT